VRHRVNGNRYEIACFPNKVLDWRKKVEKNILNVIQSDSIFKNVSKALLASAKELMDDFGTSDRMEVCRLVLDKGQLQVSERERVQDASNKLKEAIVMVAGMCVHKDTKQPIPVRMIENAAAQIKFAVKGTQPIKQQALRLFRELAEILPIERVCMRIMMSAPLSHARALKQLAALHAKAVSGVTAGARDVEVTALVDPGVYRTLCEEVSALCGAAGHVTVLETQAEEADEEVEVVISEEEEEEAEAEADKPVKRKKKKAVSKSGAGASELEAGMGRLSLGKEKREKQKTQSDEEEEAFQLLQALPNQRRRNKRGDDSDDEVPLPARNARKGKKNKSVVANDDEEEAAVSVSQTVSPSPRADAAPSKQCPNNYCTSACVCDAWGSTDDDIDAILNKSAQPAVLREDDVAGATTVTFAKPSARPSAPPRPRGVAAPDEDDDINSILSRFDGGKVKVLREEDAGQDSVMIFSKPTGGAAPAPGAVLPLSSVGGADASRPRARPMASYLPADDDEAVAGEDVGPVSFLAQDDDDYDDDLPVFVEDIATIKAVQRAQVKRGTTEAEDVYEEEEEDE
jgi:ribosome maturation protein SDO1